MIGAGQKYVERGESLRVCNGDGCCMVGRARRVLVFFMLFLLQKTPVELIDLFYFSVVELGVYFTPDVYPAPSV